MHDKMKLFLGERTVLKMFKPVICLLVTAVLLSISACGFRDIPEPVLESGGKHRENAAESQEEESLPVPVANFHYMTLEHFLEGAYTFNHDWFYFEGQERKEEGGYSRYLYRNRLSEAFRPEEFLRIDSLGEVELCALLTEQEGNCITFWADWSGESETGEREVTGYFLEKYSPEGERLWHAEYTPETFGDKGQRLNQGTVTADGRICLYDHGTDGTAFFFGEDGNLEGSCIPALDRLDGIAVGRENRIYGYCAAGKDTTFTLLGGNGEIYICPMAPKQVFDGYEDGVYLSDGKSLWSYEPESGESEKLLDWKSEYVQIGTNVNRRVTNTGDMRSDIANIQNSPIDGLFCGGGRITALCLEQEFFDNSSQRQVLTFAGITFEDSGQYPGKTKITLGYPASADEGAGSSGHLEYLVRRYNRQSLKYSVEIVYDESSVAMTAKLLQKKGADLLEVSFLPIASLAPKGVFEDLSPYYDTALWEGLLESVRKACTAEGKSFLVIPSFSIKTLRGKEKLTQEWTPWAFLEMGRENRMFEIQSPWEAFRYCMGIRKAEHFIDEEKKECTFDGEEFRRILEECAAWDSYDGTDRSGYIPVTIGEEVVGYRPPELEDAEWQFAEQYISSIKGCINQMHADYAGKMVGYPGWDGAEYAFAPENLFAMNSASPNKEGAWDFLRFLLSEEMQDCIDWEFPVRADSFAGCLEDVYDPYDEEWLLAHSPSYGALMAELGYVRSGRPTEADAAAARHMVDNAVIDLRNGLQDPVMRILYEETSMYFQGDASLDETVEKIQSRVSLYLQEQ